MEKTLVQQFLDEVPSLVNLCIHYEEENIDEDYKKRLAEAIKSRWEQLPDYDFNSMYDEVSDRVEELSRENRAEKYVYSLITPFNKYSETFHGVEIIRYSKESIDRIKGMDGSEPMIKDLQKQIHNVEQRAQKFFDIVHTMEYERDEIEDVFFEVVNCIVRGYANMLDAALAVNQMDLAKFQDECGVCIKSIWKETRAFEISEFVGSLTLADKYLAKLGNTKEVKYELPDVLDTKLARTTFKKCIDKGWMIKTDKGFLWKGIKDCKGEISQLAYLCGRIYGYKYGIDGNHGKEIPTKELSKLFNEPNIYKHLMQAYTAKKTQIWRTIIDNLFD